MLIDEYNDFENTLTELNDKEAANAIRFNSNKHSRSFKSQCDSIELSDLVKIYFEPNLAKKFS